MNAQIKRYILYGSVIVSTALISLAYCSAERKNWEKGYSPTTDSKQILESDLDLERRLEDGRKQFLEGQRRRDKLCEEIGVSCKDFGKRID